ncbi:MAG: translational GTPase TypA [Erysipelotrichia bacterium]|nr:translational GTPase TypA [Erysipelotrichia bacterium]
MQPEKIRNVAIIAHVDHGKTTLVDAMIKQSGLFRENQHVEECFMDNNDLERERGITILSKNLSLEYMGYRINLVDTPGHVDFGGEVERVLQMANGCLLLVDSFEGPMPQTRFVLKKALAAGLRPVVVINKIDRPDARVEAVEDEILDLFIDVGVEESMLNYPVLYASGRAGYAVRKMEDPRTDIIPLLEEILKQVPAPTGDLEGPGKMLITSLDYNDYVGRIGIGRIIGGVITGKSEVFRVHPGEVAEKNKILRLYSYRGIQRVEVEEAGAGDIVAICGIDNISIGDTICTELCDPEEVLSVDQPVISMSFAANTSPFSGRSGKFLTSRQIRARLDRELETNVAMRVEEVTEQRDMFLVSGRGELHLGILIETMRREGYELQVSKPTAIFKRDDSGQLLEPIEELAIDIPDSYMGIVMEVLGPRRAMLESSKRLLDNYLRLIFSVPARGLLGFRSMFLTMTNGTGIMNQCFRGYEAHRGDIPESRNGVMVATDPGIATAYAIKNLSERGTLFYGPGEEIYEGLVVGERPLASDLKVNIVKKRHVTNHRSATSEELEKLAAPRRMTLDQALEYVADDEWVEVTPAAIRLRKKGEAKVGKKA